MNRRIIIQCILLFKHILSRLTKKPVLANGLFKESVDKKLIFDGNPAVNRPARHRVIVHRLVICIESVIYRHVKLKPIDAETDLRPY